MAAAGSAFPQLTLVKNGGRYNLQPVGPGLDSFGAGGYAPAPAGQIAGPMPKVVGSYDPLRIDSSAPTIDIAKLDSGLGSVRQGQFDNMPRRLSPSASQLSPTNGDSPSHPTVSTAVRLQSPLPFSDPRGPLVPYRDQAPSSPLLLPGCTRGAEMEMLGVSAGIASSPSSPNPRPHVTQPLSPSRESADKLRGKLLDLGSSFVGFDRLVEEDTFKRRQVEQQRIREVLDGLAHIEKALEVEIRRRIEMSKATQETMEKSLSDMGAAIQNRIVQRFEQLGSSMETLFERCSTLERGIQQLRGELPTKHQVESNALVRTIRDFAHDFENDRRLRLDQDNHFLRLIQESDHNVDRRMAQELEMLEKRTEGLEGAIDEFAIEEDIPATGKRAQILEATARVRASIGEEARRRESTDDEVVQAINSYTNALHRSLCKSNV